LETDISQLTHAFLLCNTLKDFEKLIYEHERLVASIIELPRAKALYFNDFPGEIKSLGAWGGDFVMAASDLDTDEIQQYFQSKGFNIFLKYEDIVL
jgi:hypothetical protein